MRWSLYLHSGSVQGSSLPLGSFWTHIKLFCFSHPHARVCGNYVGYLWSSCPALPLVFSFLKKMIWKKKKEKKMIWLCFFPDSTQRTGMCLFWFQLPSLSRISLVLLAVLSFHPPPSIYAWASGGENRMDSGTHWSFEPTCFPLTLLFSLKPEPFI